MNYRNIDLSDLLVIVGVLCLAGAAWMALGWVGFLGFLGALMLLLGLAMARNVGGKVKG